MPDSNGPKKVTAADGHVYHKSATANAPVAPTNAHTVANATKLNGVPTDIADFITIIHMEYSLLGHLPSLTYLFDEYGYTSAEVQVYFKDETVVQALNDRGITINAKQLEPVGIPELVEAHTVSKHAPKLTPLQLVVANTLLDVRDTRSEKKKLQDCGVSTGKYNMWLKDANFAGYLKDRAESMLGEGHHEALMAMMDKVRAGDTKALSMYFEMTGRFVSQTGSNQGTTGIHDFQNIIIRIVEILSEEIDDPALAARISDRLKNLVTGAQVAGVIPLPEQAVRTPEIATPRELTPQVQQMMQEGMGVNS